MNAPQPLGGFGKLGNFCRKILSYAKSLELHPGSIIIERLPVGVTTPPSADIISTPSGKLVKLKINSGGTGDGGDPIPFALLDVSDATHNNIRVRYGYVRDVVNGVNHIPTDMNSGDDPTFVLTDVGTGFGSVFLNITITIDADTGVGTITVAAISTTAVEEDDTHTSVFLGSFSTDGSGNFHVTGAAGFLGYLYLNGHFVWAL